MSKPIHGFLLCCLVFVLLTIGAAQPGFAQDAAPTSRPQPNGVASAAYPRDIQYARSPAELLAKAQNQGRLRVIVGLNTSARFQPEGDLTTAQASIQRSGITQAKTALLNSLAPYGATVLAQSNQWTIPYLALTVDAAGLQALQNSPAVTSIQEDHQNFLSNNTASLNNMGVPPAWANGHDGSGYTVAILDIGMQATHTFFGGRVVDEYCSSTNDNSDPDVHLVSVCPGGVDNASGLGAANPATCASIAAAHSLTTEKCDHGTHVTGIAAGNDGNNGTVNDGVAREATIIGVQVFTLYDCLTVNPNCKSASDDRMTAYDSNIIDGLERVYSLRNTYQIAAVNMSLGGGFFNNQAICDTDYDSLKASIDQLRSVNIATVIASGNEYYGNGIAGPACISSAIAVGSTNDFAQGGNGQAGKLSIFTNANFMLDLLAPGFAINSSITQPPNTGFGDKDGTSMATPQVTGAWAVMREVLPNASVTQILQAFQATGKPVKDDVRADGYRCGEFGDEPCSNLTYKLINLNAAMSSLQPTKPILTAPLNNIMIPSTQPSLTWIASQRVTQYHLYLDTVNPPVAGPIILTSPSYTPPTPLQIATYYWRVQAVNNLGASNWSDIYTFSVNIPPPISYTKDTTPTLTWTPITNATSYEVQIATTTTFSLPSILHTYPVALPNLSFTIPGGDALTPGIYYWRVRALGGTGAYSPVEILVIGS